MKLDWPEYGLSFEQLEKNVLVSDEKVLRVTDDENCFLIQGWSLNDSRHVDKLKLFVETCGSRGFRWALQEGHPLPIKRGRGGVGRPYFALSRAYSPKPAWDIIVNSPGGVTYVVQKRHSRTLENANIPYRWEQRGGRNLEISTETLIPTLDAIANSLDPFVRKGEEAEYQKEKEIRDDGSIDEKYREALIRARVGQGIFRSQVWAIEPFCRLTGVSDPRFLRASHIKPWRNCSYQECLDRNNGLMLSPHVDHLFDQGYVTFEKSGLMRMKDGIAELLRAWSLPEKILGGAFSDAQEAYLAYHRTHIFKP